MKSLTTSIVNKSCMCDADRNKWADHRENFFSAGKNKASLSAIENAAFVIVFEDHDEEIPDEVDNDKMSSYCKDLLCGQGWTRWFDKSVTLICYPNAHIGINAEHSWYAISCVYVCGITLCVCVCVCVCVCLCMFVKGNI